MWVDSNFFRPSHIPPFKKNHFLDVAFSSCIGSRPVNPKHNLKQIAEGAHTRTRWAWRETQTSDVLCRGGEARRGESHSGKHGPQDQNVFLLCSLSPTAHGFSAWSHLRSDYLYPPCSTVRPLSSRTSNTPTSSLYHLSLSFWHQIALCNKSFYCRLLIIYPLTMPLHWIIATVIHVSDNPSPGEHLLW